MSGEHEWCRDVQRDEAVRAAEDAAAVPAIQHRDLPEQVALLWASLGDIIGRVVRLEGEMDAGQDEEASPAEGMRKEHGESVRVVEDADAASDEAIAHGATLSALAEARESLAAANRGIARLTAERDAAIRERDAALYRLDGAMRGCVRLNNDRPAVRASVAELKAERDAARAECERLRALVAVLEAAPPPRGWLTKEDCEALYLANAVLHGVFVGSWREKHDAAQRLEAIRVRALSGAGEEAAPPPRGWLTAEEREAVEEAMVDYASNVGDHDCERIERVLRALLARSTPPKVRRPNPNVLTITAGARDRMWIAAIRAAGGEVADE